MDVPFETIRRQVAAMIADDLLDWKDGGVIVPTRILTSERHIDNNRRIIVHLEQMIAALTALALDNRN